MVPPDGCPIFIKQVLSRARPGSINVGIFMNQGDSATGHFYAHTAEGADGRPLPRNARMGSRSASQTSKRFMPRPGLDGFHTAWVLHATQRPAWSLALSPRILSLRATRPNAPAFPRLRPHLPLKRPHASGPRPIPGAAASLGPQRSASGSGQSRWSPHQSHKRPAAPSAGAARSQRRSSQSLLVWRESTKTRPSKQSTL